MQLLIISNSSFRNGPKDLVARTCGNFKFYSRLVRSSSPRDLLVKVVIDLGRGNFVVSERPSRNIGILELFLLNWPCTGESAPISSKLTVGSIR